MNARSVRHANYKNIDTAEASRLRKLGWSYSRIGKRLGVSPTTVLTHLTANARLIERVCLLPECGHAIRTYNPRRFYCTRSHAKLDGSRKSKGLELVQRECALPECKAKVWAFENTRKYCSQKHADLDWRRWKKHAHGTGVYARIIIGKPCCNVCGETAVIDKHHVDFTGNKSSRSSKQVYLCPTHHMLIHRGFARFSAHGVYERLDSLILDGLRLKQPKRVASVMKTQTAYLRMNESA